MPNTFQGTSARALQSLHTILTRTRAYSSGIGVAAISASRRAHTPDMSHMEREQVGQVNWWCAKSERKQCSWMVWPQPSTDTGRMLSNRNCRQTGQLLCVLRSTQVWLCAMALL